MVRKVKVDVGSGNIFADLGLPDANIHFLKAQNRLGNLSS